MPQFVKVNIGPSDNSFWEGWNRKVIKESDSSRYTATYGSGAISTKDPDRVIATGWIDPVEGAKIALVNDGDWSRAKEGSICWFRLLTLDTKGRVNDLTDWLLGELDDRSLITEDVRKNGENFSTCIDWVEENLIKPLTNEQVVSSL